MVPCFLDEIMGKLMGHGSSAFVPSVCKLNQRTNKWFSYGPSLHHPHNLFYFVHKIWMLWKQNWGLVHKKFYILITTRDPHMWRLWGFSYRLQYSWTFSKKAHEFEFQPWKRQPTFLGNFILSLWMWVISIMQIAFHGWKRKLRNKVNNKLNYQQTTLV
jgi:hypothetical protein